MRIAIATENFMPKVDGVTRTLAKLLEHLQSTGHQVVVFGPESHQSSYAGAEVYGTTGIPFLFYPELRLNIWRPAFTKKLIQFDPQVIHIVDPVYMCPALLTILRWKNVNIPVVSSYHTNLGTYCKLFGYGLFEPLMWTWNRYCHHSCRTVVCPSESTRSTLSARGFHNLKVWPRGIDTQLFTPLKQSSSLRTLWSQGLHKVIILYVGRVSFEKNLGLTIDAYRDMDHSRCHLVIVGNGPALSKLQGTPDVTFTGYLQGEALAIVYASADIFAFPSFTETFGQVVLEAMASGLPVVGLLAEGVRDLVDHKETGMLLHVTHDMKREIQVKHYRKLLTSLVNNKKERERLSMNAIEKGKSFTWFDAMEKLVDVYRDAASS